MVGKTCHIAFCMNDAYVPYVMVPVKSIAENHSNTSRKICLHILTDYISEINTKRLYDIVENYDNLLLQIHLIDSNTVLSDLKTGNWPVHAWYRILLPKILPNTVEKVLYLDPDTIVTSNISELFIMDMTGKAIAAVLDILSFDDKTFIRCGYTMHKQYICAGVMMMNLDYWRKYHLADKIINWAKKNSERMTHPDQDAINYICQDIKIVLPLRYGFTHCFCEYDMFYKPPYREQLEQCIDNPAIIHYCGCVPWGREYHKHIMHYEWEKYNRMLRHPIRRTYQARGWKKMKIMWWDLLHLYQGRKRLTIAEVKKRLFSN